MVTDKVRSVLVASAVAVFALAASAGDMAKRFTVTLPDPLGAETLADLPVLVRLSPAIAGFDYADFLTDDGSDLVFKDASGVTLPHEIDTWNTNGVSLVWVKLPLASGGETVTCYYGGDAQESAASAVWTAYTGVWHMGATNVVSYESIAYAAFPNATGLAGTDGIIDGVSRAGAEGVLGSCVDIWPTYSKNSPNAKAQAGVFVPHDSGLHDYGTFTLSVWIRPRDNEINWNRSFGNFDGTDGFLLDMKDLTNGYKYYCNEGKIDAYFAFDPSPTKDGWTQMAFVFDGKDILIYENGSDEPIATGAAKDNTTKSSELRESLGKLGLGNYGASFGAAAQTPFAGYIDEVRLMGSKRTAADIAAEYRMVSDPSALTYGPVMSNVEGATYPVAVRCQDGVTLAYSAEAAGEEGGVRSFAANTELVITATGPEGARFVGWYDQSGAMLTNGNALAFTVSSARSFVCKFATGWVCDASASTLSDGLTSIPCAYSSSKRTVTVSGGAATEIDVSGIVDLSGPVTLASDGAAVSLVGFADGALKLKPGLKALVLPDSVTTIGNQSFAYCSNLVSVVLGEGLKKIDTYAFRECVSLKSVTPFLPASVATLGQKVFYGCSGLEGDLRLENPDMTRLAAAASYTFQSAGRITSVSLPYITHLYAYDFASSAVMTNVTFGAGSVDFDGTRVFSGCAAQAEVFFPGAAPTFSVADRPFGTQTVLIFCDPQMDADGWARVQSLDAASTDGKTSLKFEPVTDDMRAASDYPGAKTLGRLAGTYDKTKTYHYWLVAFKSPLRKAGLVLFVR